MQEHFNLPLCSFQWRVLSRTMPKSRTQMADTMGELSRKKWDWRWQEWKRQRCILTDLEAEKANPFCSDQLNRMLSVPVGQGDQRLKSHKGEAMQGRQRKICGSKGWNCDGRSLMATLNNMRLSAAYWGTTLHCPVWPEMATMIEFGLRNCDLSKLVTQQCSLPSMFHDVSTE